MKIPKIYLETTIFNFPFADDAPQYKADTLKLFSEIRLRRFESFASEYVLEELNKTTDENKRDRMKALISEYNVKTHVKVTKLADLLISTYKMVLFPIALLQTPYI
ncbi:hypothetical protein AGMMS49936_10840 [Endomicrobiia bacterium]|nr:hypothetical protein AGMMS49936_10840 [Endomicrobiia bacterium]